MSDGAAFGYHPALARQLQALRDRGDAVGAEPEPEPESGAQAMRRQQEALARALSRRESVMAGAGPPTEADRRASWYAAAGYTPEDVRGGMRGLMSSPTQIAKATEMAMGMGPGATVFHGSPHRFEKFSAEKIGTGEGAQAYGHGLYFAENPAVARDYATKLAADKTWRAADEVGVDPISEMYTAVGPGGVKKSFHNQAEALDWVRQGRENLYHVDLPDEQIARMIDWDKPLAQQAEAVRNALQPTLQQLEEKKRGLMRAFPASEVEGEIGKWRAGLTGQSLIDEVSAFSGRSEPQASKYLQEQGIPGIRYLDQGSRAGGEGTSNYVVFNPEILKILRRE